jgi:hypothetical protein
MNHTQATRVIRAVPARAQSLTWAPPPGTLLERYERASDRALAAAGWYEALMCYRIACMTSLNLRLHRTGRRVDPAWEVFGEALPYLFQRARAAGQRIPVRSRPMISFMISDVPA